MIYNCVLFILNDISIGGISINVVQMINELKNKEIQIFWIHRRDYISDLENLKYFKDNYIEEIICNDDDLISGPQINIDCYNQIKIWTYSLSDFILAEIIKNKYATKDKIIDTIIWIQHYKDFFEEECKGIKKKILYYICKKNYIKMEKNKNIFYISRSHITGYEKHYKYKVENIEEKIYTESNSETYFFDEKKVREKYKLKDFNIISISRFDFPHKGFVIGLIDNVSKILDSYNNVYLYIIGYGKDENIVCNEINAMPEYKRDHVILLGKKDYNDIPPILDKMHLNIGLAATVRLGAINGLISLPVQHYSYSCSTYGFLPESKEYSLSEENGYSIIEYIKKVYEMSENEYVDMCKKSCYSYYKNSLGAIKCFDLKNKKNKTTISKSLLFIYKLYRKKIYNRKG